MTRRRSPLLSLLPCALVVACGGRTGIPVPNERTASPADAGIDAPHDAGSDVSDAGHDSSVDTGTDAGPPDASKPDGRVPQYCSDAGLSPIYVLTQENNLYSFYPPTLTFTLVGTMTCGTNLSAPNSMAVAYTGTAYTNLEDGTVYQLDTRTAACTPTPYIPAPPSGPFYTFGMGYSGTTTTTESLFIIDNGATTYPELGTINTTTFERTLVGILDQPYGGCELTGTGDGRLFTFCVNGDIAGAVAELDPKTAHVIDAGIVPLNGAIRDWAFSFWGGEFWLFTSMGYGSSVTEYNPVSGTSNIVTSIPEDIVGAGVSTCAPE